MEQRWKHELPSRKMLAPTQTTRIKASGNTSSAPRAFVTCCRASPVRNVSAVPCSRGFGRPLSYVPAT